LSSRAACSSATKSPADIQSNQHRAGLGGGLHASSDVRRVAEHLPGRLHDRRPEADARRKLWRALATVLDVDLSQRALDRQRRPHRPLGVVLLRLRIAEEGHQPVAELLEDMPAKPGHRVRSFVQIGVDQVAPVLRVELRGEACRSDEVAKHHCDRAALGRNLWGFGKHRGGWRSANRFRADRRRQRSNRVEQFTAMPDASNPQILKVLRRQALKDLVVDFIFSKRRFVLGKAQITKPAPDIHLFAPARPAG
jgi:hypothetical protein